MTDNRISWNSSTNTLTEYTGKENYIRRKYRSRRDEFIFKQSLKERKEITPKYRIYNHFFENIQFFVKHFIGDNLWL